MKLSEDSGIYLLYCIENNQGYVGSCDNFYGRNKGHYVKLKSGKHNTVIQSDYYRFGWEKFKMEILEFIHPNKFETIDEYDNYLVERENYWMDKLGTYNPNKILGKGYNIQKAHRVGSFGRENISNSLKGRKFTNEHKENLRINSTGKKHSNETIKKMKENHADFSGIKNPNSKLTIEQCQNIYNLLKEKTNEKKMDKYKRIANLFGINESHVRAINGGRHWSNKYLNS